VQNTHTLENLGTALVDLIGFLNSPQRDNALLDEAGVTIDRGLLPLVVALGARGPLSVVPLAELVGRHHTTVSRELGKLEDLRLVEQCAGDSDRRVRTIRLTRAGAKIAGAIARARRRLLSRALAAWSEKDLDALARLNRRFADALKDFARKDKEA
jgi:DNA-binding MarR family transcriptional regulator